MDDDVIIVSKEGSGDAEAEKMDTTEPSGDAEAGAAEGQVFKVMDSVGEVDAVIPVIDAGKSSRSTQQNNSHLLRKTHFPIVL